MPFAPRLARAQWHEPVTRAADPIAVVVLLRWFGKRPELVPGHAVAWCGEPHPAVLVEWTWDHPTDGGLRQDWFVARDVRRKQPTAEEYREMVAQPAWWPT